MFLNISLVFLRWRFLLWCLCACCMFQIVGEDHEGIFTWLKRINQDLHDRFEPENDPAKWLNMCKTEKKAWHEPNLKSRQISLQGRTTENPKGNTRWCFHICFILTPTWGNDPIWVIFLEWVETTNQGSRGILFRLDASPEEANHSQSFKGEINGWNRKMEVDGRWICFFPCGCFQK